MTTMHRDTMTSWIELADERQFMQATALGQAPRLIAPQHSRFGDTIRHLPAYLRHALSHGFGGHH
jgi:hypothetical protein